MNSQHKKSDKSTKRWGTGEIIVENAHVLNNNDQPQTVYTDNDETLKLTVRYKSINTDEPDPVFGVVISDGAGQRVFASNTLWKKTATRRIRANESVLVSWIIPNVFNTGTYTVSPAVADRAGVKIYDWSSDLLAFKIRKKIHSNAIVNVAHKITVD